MLQNKFEMPLDLAVKTSKIFNTYLGVVFILSLISIFVLNSLSLILQIFLFSLLLMMVVFILKKEKTNRITSLKLNKDEKWELEINKEKMLDVELSGECIVTYFLIWLNFKDVGNKGKSKVFHLLLLPDSSDRDLLRQLRVRLRFLKILTTEDTLGQDARK